MSTQSPCTSNIYTSITSLLLFITAIVMIMISTTAAQAQTDSLTSFLQSQLGVSQSQASGGAGILLGQAQSQLQPDSFKQLSRYIPNINQLISSAPTSTQSSAPENQLEFPLGGISGLSDISLTSIITGFQSLGLGADMPLKFGSAIQDYLQKTGGSSASSLLLQALPSTLQ